MINRKVHLKSRCNPFTGFLDFPVTRSFIAMNSFLLPVRLLFGHIHVLVSSSPKKKVDIQPVPESASRSALPWSTEPMKQGVKLTCEMKDAKGKRIRSTFVA